jgi:hypothetical protein
MRQASGKPIVNDILVAGNAVMLDVAWLSIAVAGHELPDAASGEWSGSSTT